MELLEREGCLAELADWLHRAGQGGCVALVAGEAGIGKSVLLQEFKNQQRKVRVLSGACDSLYTPRPLAPLHDIGRQTQGALWAAINSGAARDVIFGTTLELLEQAPTLVVFEDLHWADEATLDLLKYLGRRIQSTRAMIVLTYRDDEVGPRHPLKYVIGDLPHASVRRLFLSPLSESAVVQLAQRAQRPSAGLHRLTGGNPLFVTEVLAAAADTVPATVSDAVLARAARLSPAARDLAELVCVVPGRTELWLLEGAVGADEAGIEGCLNIGMVRDEDGSLAYRHELSRRAIEDSLSQPRLQSLHAKVLAGLAARPDIAAARLAYHAHGARDAAGVLQFAPLAASQAALVGAHRAAASHLEIALRYANRLAPAERARLQEQLSYEYYLTGRYQDAIAAQRLALEVWRASGTRRKEGASLRWLARLSWFSGDDQEAARYGIEAVVTLESLPPGPELAMAYCTRADLDLESHQGDSAIDWAQRAIALARTNANNEILCHAFNTLGTMRLIMGDASGWRDLEWSLELALAGGFQEHVARAYMSMAAMAVSRREYDQASRCLSAGLTYCEARDLDSLGLYMLAYRVRLRFEQGDWHEAGKDAEAVLRNPHATSVTRIPTLRILGHLRIRRGDPDASSPLEEVRTLGGDGRKPQRVGTLAAICAEAAWLDDDRAGVIREAQPAYEMVRERRDPRMKGELATWLWRAGALEEHPTDIAQPYALEIAGDWRAAARLWNELGCRYEEASVLALYGRESEQREALILFDQLGAAPAAQALRRRMRATGIPCVPRGSRSSTRRSPLGLTRRETQILALVSDGMRNSAIAKRLFLSTKTVDRHVSAILMKLGVQSRGEAAAKVRNAPTKGA
jgi:DNA-binding CsgD family transcriptional regulator/tetratricopeptide (TPR) repeat protein